MPGQDYFGIACDKKIGQMPVESRYKIISSITDKSFYHVFKVMLTAVPNSLLVQGQNALPAHFSLWNNLM